MSADGENGLFPDTNPATIGNGRRRRALFLPRYLREAGGNQQLAGSERDAAHTVIIKWADLELSGKLNRKESALEAEFLTEVFGKALGYTLFSENLPAWQIEPKYVLPGGGFADAAIGLFSQHERPAVRAVIELKGPTVDLDRDRSQGRTAVQQCWDYLNDLPGCLWGIVCNCVSFRLYHRNRSSRAYELFKLQDLRDQMRFCQFYSVFTPGGLLPGALGQKPRADDLLTRSEHQQLTVGAKLYDKYRQERVHLIRVLRGDPHRHSLDDAIRIGQKLLDRIIFIAFCEDRELLPAKALERTWRDIGPWTQAKNPRWENFRNLFRTVDKGNDREGITRYNGGLFDPEKDPEIDALDLDDAHTAFFKEIGDYDFCDEINVDVLGHFFEQSVTELEQLRADPAALDAPTGKATVGKRKREGIYYTPPHITHYIVDQTIGTVVRERFAALAEQFGVDPAVGPTGRARGKWTEFNEARLDALRRIRVCDPACGSGAFLIAAYDLLEDIYDEVITALCLDDPHRGARLIDEISSTILNENLFGVDLSHEAVEITQLALWLRTARRGKSLADLSEQIKAGNSLVDDAEVDSRAFNWNERFAAVMAAGGFDCVIGNPPYVKLQNFRRREPRVAEYLVGRYRAAKTGNFDMYLPFIERGIELLNPEGRMGFIAPSVWIFNEYGRGLRELIAETGWLHRFIDFKSHQVFEDATTYTALQFFTKTANGGVHVAEAADGDLKQLHFFKVPRKRLGGAAWALLDDANQSILDRMRRDSVPLKEASEAIIVGIQTSADSVYHLMRLGPGRYYSHAKAGKSVIGEVELEDDLLKPLVSGEDAVPFATPPTDTYLLFPYRVTKDDARLMAERELRKFKRCWAYLKQNEKLLRSREEKKFDDGEWWRFGRPQNLDKQELAKIGVPQTVNHLQAFCDPKGERYFNNVRVNGILQRADGAFSIWYLLALMNSTALDFFFRHIAKPKDRDYFEANKQFIAPLPIPNIKPKSQAALAKLAQSLAALHARRLKVAAAVYRRLQTDLPPKELLRTTPLPATLTGRLQSFDETPRGEVLTDMEKLAERKLKPAERERWDNYLTQQADELSRIRRNISDATADLNGQVNALYGLDAEAVRRIGETAAC